MSLHEVLLMKKYILFEERSAEFTLLYNTEGKIAPDTML